MIKLALYNFLSDYNIILVREVLFRIVKFKSSCDCISTTCFRFFLFYLFFNNCTSPLNWSISSIVTILLILFRPWSFLFFNKSNCLLLHMIRRWYSILKIEVELDEIVTLKALCCGEYIGR